MALLDKINDFAKVATEKTNNAIETTKLSVKIEGEQRTLDAIIKKIGEYYVAKIDDGEILDEEVMYMFDSIKKQREKIAELRAEVESIKNVLTGIDGIISYECTESQEDGVYRFRIEAEKKDDMRDTLFFAMAERRCAVVEMERQESSLESIFLTLTQDDPAADTEQSESCDEHQENEISEQEDQQ